MRQPEPRRLLILCYFVGLALACGGNTQQQTLKATFVSVNTARDGFLAWDRLEQEHIVERSSSIEDGTFHLNAHVERTRPVVEGFTLVYEALAFAALEPSDQTLATALRLAAELYDLINATVFKERER